MPVPTKSSWWPVFGRSRWSEWTQRRLHARRGGKQRRENDHRFYSGGELGPPPLVPSRRGWTRGGLLSLPAGRTARENPGPQAWGPSQTRGPPPRPQKNCNPSVETWNNETSYSSWTLFFNQWGNKSQKASPLVVKIIWILMLFDQGFLIL